MRGSTMRRRNRNRTNYDAPLKHPDHPRPRTRRQLLSQGFIFGAGTVLAGSLLTLRSNKAMALTLDPQLIARLNADPINCGVGVQGAGKIPFICFDLAGGSSVAGSNVLIGQRNGQLDFLTTEGYGRQGLPADMVPPIVNTATGTNDFIDTQLGLAFHSDSAFLRGIVSKLDPAGRAATNGAVIPARSENDTSNNPHNPMYGIARTGSDGELLTLIGSQNSDSGGNSIAPMSMVDLTKRPTKIDRPTDVTGLIDTGDLTSVLNPADAVAVMESIYRLSDAKVGLITPNSGDPITTDDVIKDLVRCGYLKSADLADRYAGVNLNPGT